MWQHAPVHPTIWPGDAAVCDCAAMIDRIYRPCSSLTAHTMRSTQAALAWQRSLRGLGSPGNRSSWRTLWISDWLLLNCSRTKSWTSLTKLVCTSEQRFTWNDHIRQRSKSLQRHYQTQTLQKCSFKRNNGWISATFHVIERVSQHLEHADVQRVAEGFVEEIDAWICLH